MTTNPFTYAQISIALGIMSGRIDPATMHFDEAKELHPEIESAIGGGCGNPGADAHRRKAETIVWSLLRQ